jgi:hypothetical protein
VAAIAEERTCVAAVTAVATIAGGIAGRAVAAVAAVAEEQPGIAAVSGARSGGRRTEAVAAVAREQSGVAAVGTRGSAVGAVANEDIEERDGAGDREERVQQRAAQSAPTEEVEVTEARYLLRRRDHRRGLRVRSDQQRRTRSGQHQPGPTEGRCGPHQWHTRAL